MLWRFFRWLFRLDAQEHPEVSRQLQIMMFEDIIKAEAIRIHANGIMCKFAYNGVVGEMLVGPHQVLDSTHYWRLWKQMGGQDMKFEWPEEDDPDFVHPSRRE